MVRFVPVVRLYQYRFCLIITLFVYFPFLTFLYHQYFIPYEYVNSSPSKYTRYERYCRQVDQRIKIEQRSNILIEVDPRNESIPYLYSEWRSTSLLPRLLTPCEHAIHMDLLSILIKHIFKKHNIQYMMMAATLLGSYTRHDLLPWDDDVDIRVSIRNRSKLQSIILDELSAEPYSMNIMEIHNPRNYDKVFFSWCPYYSKEPWPFPFIDVFYYDENSTHVWLLGQPSSCPVRREDVFPLVLRPLGSLWLYGPREPMAHFESRKMTKIETGCYLYAYSHKYERQVRPDILFANCSELKSIYPYVERQCTPRQFQDTLHVLCNQFPLDSNVNDSSLQCARLQLDKNVPTSAFNLDRPTQIILFFIVYPQSSSISHIDISIDFYQSSSSSIDEIRLALLVPQFNFTINNDTSTVYTSYEIPIFRWQISTENTYDPIDLIQLGNQDYQTDTSFCKWDSNRWDRLFNGNMSNNVSYVYFLKTTNLQLEYTLINTSDKSSLSLPPAPYLNILYCVPYRLGVTEMVLLICFSVLFISTVSIVGILHYFKTGEDDRVQHIQRYIHDRATNAIHVRNHLKNTRHRLSIPMSYAEQEDQTPD